MTKNNLQKLEHYGQSIWLDFISRKLLDSGKLLELIKQDNLKGLTSNPVIFEKAIAESDSYEQLIQASATNDAQELYELLAIRDIQDAADLLKPVYQQTKHEDGYVSLEVSPHAAHNAALTIKEALSLWQRVNRPNIMIKVPGTDEGMVAIKELTSQGLNINVTLLFSVNAYKQAAQAYLEGLASRAQKNLPLKNIHSVASFFVSRIDSKLDSMLERKNNLEAQALMGKVAIANAKLAYEAYLDLYKSPYAKDLLFKGAHPQRLLWASTGTKNKNYSDVLYVESLIGPHTVNTLPPATLDAFRDHGRLSNSLQENLLEAHEVFKNLKQLNINFELCSKELLEEGLKLFEEAFDKLLTSLAQKKKL